MYQNVRSSAKYFSFAGNPSTDAAKEFDREVKSG